MFQEIMNYHTNEEYSKPVIYFGNRISDTANRYTNYDSFAEAIGKLSKITDIEFEAIMLNPTRKVTDKQLNLIKDSLVLIENNLERFKRSHPNIENIEQEEVLIEFFLNLTNNLASRQICVVFESDFLGSDLQAIINKLRVNKEVKYFIIKNLFYRKLIKK